MPLDEETKAEILAILHSNHEETFELIGRVIGEQARQSSTLSGLQAEIAALKARGTAWDAAQSGNAVAMAEVAAEARRIASEGKAEAVALVTHATDQIKPLVASLSAKVDALVTDVDGMKSNIDTAVLNVLDAHVVRIEAAAAKLTSSPRVKTAATIAGTFAGGALASIALEIAKHL